MAPTEQIQVATKAIPRDAVTDARGGSIPIALLGWALAASTLHRIRLGEGALLAINLSILVQRGAGFADFVAGALVSTLTLAMMYAFNDAYDAIADQHNPKKDRRLVSAYIDHRATCYAAIFGGKAFTLAFAWLLLGPTIATAVAAVLAINFVYSTMLKGVPVVDVVWCGLWGAAYAAIADPSIELLVLAGLMTAVCHLYQALGDRSSDAENRITTTAVFSAHVSAGVLFVLSAAIYLMLRAPLGELLALSAFVPFALYFLLADSRSAWLLTKVYFGMAWIVVLEHGRAVV